MALSALAQPEEQAEEQPEDPPSTTQTVRLPGTTVRLELTRTPAGEITHQRETVQVPGLWVGTTEVTWDLYDVYLYELDKPDPDAADADGVTRPSKPYIPPDRGFGHHGYPALGMTRHAAEQFCVWLSKSTGHTYRLPTRAEWTYLALAGSGDRFFGVPEADLAEHAWFANNADDTPHPAGTRKPNAWGLHDMHGNLAEWVITDNDTPIALGGSYLDELDRCTVRASRRQSPSWQASDPQIPKSTWWLSDGPFVGFRVVRDVTADEPHQDQQHESEPTDD
jgi:formylglycine-generating enzyme required for sulfatase activity